jgi:hypothetical protein
VAEIQYTKFDDEAIRYSKHVVDALRNAGVSTNDQVNVILTGIIATAYSNGAKHLFELMGDALKDIMSTDNKSLKINEVSYIDVADRVRGELQNME